MEPILRIQWAPRVKKARVARLYQLDALGLADEDLAAVVGFDLHQRCRSILMVTAANQVDCPGCGGLVESGAGRWSRQNPVLCPACGFRATYGQWRDSWRGRDLVGGNAVPVYQAYFQAYPQAKSPAARLLLIDQLLHAFHFSMRRQRAFRPVASQLIEGSPEEVLAFLIRLSGVRYTTSGLNIATEQWQRSLEKAAAQLPFLGQRLEQARALARRQEETP